MAKAGDELQSPLFERLVFRKTAADTNGELLEVEAFFRPASEPPPDHLHPIQEERLEVVSGELTTHMEGADRTYGPGETLVVPRGTRHSMHNLGEQEARVIWQTIPALKTEQFFETMWGLTRDGRTNAKGVPPLPHVAVLMREYRDCFRLANPPYAVQQALFAVLAPIGRLMGYRARYPEYSG